MNANLTYEERIKRQRYLRHKKLKKQRRQNFISFIIMSVMVIASIALTIDFLKYPECYLTTWKYQLKNDIKAGNQEMIDYYNRTYVANGRILFDDIEH